MLRCSAFTSTPETILCPNTPRQKSYLYLYFPYLGKLGAVVSRQA